MRPARSRMQDCQPGDRAGDGDARHKRNRPGLSTGPARGIGAEPPRPSDRNDYWSVIFFDAIAAPFDWSRAKYTPLPAADPSARRPFHVARKLPAAAS